MKAMARAFVSIGSNLEPEQNIAQAIHLLGQAVRITALSTFYRTPALGRTPQPDFYNGVVALETELKPLELKRRVLRPLEAALGRQRGPDKYAPRPIDLDLLIYDQCVLATGELVLPDPQIVERAFLAIPLYELAPDLVLPGSDLPLSRVAGGMSKEALETLTVYSRRLQEALRRPK
jgi:dihydroneopterin aldolase/2-amino-4-hydroxy-6-hydroxymethyldihydropteridine diphosphokinase